MITYEIVQKTNFLEIRAEDILTDKDCSEYRNKILNDDRLKPGFKQLLDLTRVKRVEISDEGLQNFASLNGKGNAYLLSICCAVVSGNSNTYSFAKEFERILLLQGARIIVFNHRSTACTWLGIEY